MRLTAFTDYSLRVLLYLANAPEGRATIAEIASAFDVSHHHLTKVANLLGKQGFLLNTRGRRGGLRLARPAAQINVGAVVRATEAGSAVAECFDPATNTCPLAGGCGLQRALKEAVGRFYDSLDHYSVADLDLAPRKLGRVLRVRHTA